MFSHGGGGKFDRTETMRWIIKIGVKNEENKTGNARPPQGRAGVGLNCLRKEIKRIYLY